MSKPYERPSRVNAHDNVNYFCYFKQACSKRYTTCKRIHDINICVRGLTGECFSLNCFWCKNNKYVTFANGIFTYEGTKFKINVEDEKRYISYKIQQGRKEISLTPKGKIQDEIKKISDSVNVTQELVDVELMRKNRYINMINEGNDEITALDIKHGGNYYSIQRCKHLCIILSELLENTYFLTEKIKVTNYTTKERITRLNERHLLDKWEYLMSFDKYCVDMNHEKILVIKNSISYFESMINNL
jgi:hypothetical protein